MSNATPPPFTSLLSRILLLIKYRPIPSNTVNLLLTRHGLGTGSGLSHLQTPSCLWPLAQTCPHLPDTCHSTEPLGAGRTFGWDGLCPTPRESFNGAKQDKEMPACPPWLSGLLSLLQSAGPLQPRRPAQGPLPQG